MKFLPLFDVQLMHPYYADGLCPDFEVEPSAETRQQLANYRCLLKPLYNGVRLFVSVDDAKKTLITMPAKLCWIFYLRLGNPDFALFTDQTEIAADGIPLFTNTGASAADTGILTRQIRQEWATESFLVQQPTALDHYVLRGRPLPGLKLEDLQVSGVISALSDFDVNTKFITLDSRGKQTGDIFTVRYQVQPALQDNHWGEVEIWNNSLQPTTPQAPSKFQVTFKTKQSKWVYYLVTDNKSNELSLQDQGAHPITFASQQIDHDQVDTVAQQLATQYPALQRWRFVSNELIDYKAAANKTLQLLIGNHAVITPLPNPSLRNYRIGQVREGVAQDETFLYHIVTYFSHGSIT